MRRTSAGSALPCPDSRRRKSRETIFRCSAIPMSRISPWCWDTTWNEPRPRSRAHKYDPIMRPLELSIALASVSYLFCLSFGSGLSNPVVHYLPFAALLLVALHLITEGYRWHMIPAYALVALILLSYPWCNSHHFRIRLTDMAIGWAMAFALLGASAVAAG